MSTTRFVLGAAAVLVAAMLSACAPEPSSSPEATTAPAPVTSQTPQVSPSSTPTADAAQIELPGACTDIYSAELLASLEAEIPPLNDPGVTMLPSQNATLLETLDSLQTIRCSWGQAGEVGLVTNVSIVDADQSAAIEAELSAAGYGCAQESDATICRIEQRGVSLDDVEYTRGETHALRGNAWVATAWLNYAPDGYTEEILATLWA
jgi:hypothetical protein